MEYELKAGSISITIKGNADEVIKVLEHQEAADAKEYEDTANLVDKRVHKMMTNTFSKLHLEDE